MYLDEWVAYVRAKAALATYSAPSDEVATALGSLLVTADETRSREDLSALAVALGLEPYAAQEWVDVMLGVVLEWPRRGLPLARRWSALCYACRWRGKARWTHARAVNDCYAHYCAQ